MKGNWNEGRNKIETMTVGDTVKTSAKIHAKQLWIVLLCGFDHRYDIVHICTLPIHIMIQDKTMLILQNIYRNSLWSIEFRNQNTQR